MTFVEALTVSEVEDEEEEEEETRYGSDQTKYLAPIKNQGRCGSCWAFSAVASYEAANAKKKGGSVSQFSEQQQVDCNKNCYGCNGGNPYFSFQFWQKNGAASESCYKYTGKDGSCSSKCPAAGPKVRSIGYTNGESKLASALSKQVISVGIVADHIMNYNGGIFDGYCGGRVDHAVNVVADGSNYWKLRNSWGTSWGEKGYFRFAKGKNQCQIGSMITWPVL